MSLSSLFTWLVRLLAGLAVLSAAAAALLWTVLSGSLPEYEAQVTAAEDGLPTAPVEIRRDAWGIPHISGATERDVFFALGYAHAQDRLWQMEFSRRTAQGRLAELFGEIALPADRLMRGLELHRLAQASFSVQSPEAQAALTAYAAGVNARIRKVQEGALGRGAPEFFLFPARLSPWTPADSLSIGKLMALQLSDQAGAEVRRALFALSLPPARLRDVLPDEPLHAIIEAGKYETADGPRRSPFHGGGQGATTPRKKAALEDGGSIAGTGIEVGAAEASADAPQAALPWLAHLLRGTPGELPPESPGAKAFMAALLPEADHAGASNAWAVAAGRAAAGASILANDPHLPFTAPSPWHLDHLNLPQADGSVWGVIGATVPGMPFVFIGRNPDFAWGMTAAYIDDADIFIEKIDPDDPGRYLTPTGPARFRERTELIALPDGATREAKLRWTRHGPVLPPEHLGVGRVTPAGHVAALSWTALADGDRSLTAALNLMKARGLEEGLAAAAEISAPGLNVTMATKEEVGMVVAGKIPLRAPGTTGGGRLPSPGWTGAGDWTGWAPAEAHPRVLRPASGAVANTNNRTAGPEAPVHVSSRWGDSYRILRLDRQLAAREFHTRDSAQALQSDAVSEMARAVLPLIARELWWGAEPPGDDPVSKRRARAVEMLADWNGEMSAHAPEPLIFAEWMRRLTVRLAADELGPLIDRIPGPQPVFVERVFRNIDGAEIWCDVNKTPARETCGEIAQDALDEALAYLAQTYGDAPEGWRWGEAHRALHAHPVLTNNPLAALVADIEHDMSGGDFTLLRAQSAGTGPRPHEAIHGAGFRMVVDFADPDASMFILSTGESGHPFSRRYDDMNELWRRGDMVRMSMDPDHANAGSAGLTVISPPGGG